MFKRLENWMGRKLKEFEMERFRDPPFYYVFFIVAYIIFKTGIKAIDETIKEVMPDSYRAFKTLLLGMFIFMVLLMVLYVMGW